MSRIASVKRITGETQIELTLNLDGSGKCEVENPIGFFDHMLKSFCKHGLFDLTGSIKGDLEVDQHHIIEDTGIVLGECFKKALGNWRDSGMTRNPSVENDAKLIVLTKINKYFREKVFY